MLFDGEGLTTLRHQIPPILPDDDDEPDDALSSQLPLPGALATRVSVFHVSVHASLDTKGARQKLPSSVLPNRAPEKLPAVFGRVQHGGVAKPRPQRQLRTSRRMTKGLQALFDYQRRVLLMLGDDGMSHERPVGCERWSLCVSRHALEQPFLAGLSSS